MLLALFCGFFVNLIKKSLTTRFGANDAMIIFSAPSRGQQVLTPLGVEQTTSLLVVLIQGSYRGSTLRIMLEKQSTWNWSQVRHLEMGGASSRGTSTQWNWR